MTTAAPESDGELLSRMGTDAQLWAREWVRRATEIETSDDDRKVIDEDWMLGWFANAIEAGRSAGSVNLERSVE